MAARPEQLLHHIRRLASVPAASSVSDADLLARFVHDRDEESFAALVRRHGPMVLGVCRRILNNVQDAEDAFQAAFLVLARKADSVKPRLALTAWLYGVARRVALKARTARMRQCRAIKTIPSPPIDPHASPLDDLSARELLAIFDEELQRLPRTYRLPLILCCIEGRSQEEAARQLDWTPGSVKGRLERGRARLHDRLLRRGLVLSAILMTVEATRVHLFAALAETTVHASLRFLAGSGASGAAALLAEAALRGMAWSRGAVWAALLSAVVVLAGTGTLAFSTRPAESEQPSVPTPQQAQQPEPRRDQQGDPLPRHAIARLGTLRFRGIRGYLAFSLDGKWLASETDGGVALWERATGRAIRHIVAPGMYLSFSADGKRLACSNNLHCHIVDVSNGKELFTVEGTHGIFASDGKTLVTANAFISPWRVHVWDARTGKQLRQWAAGEWIQEIALAADGGMAAWINQHKSVIQIRDLKNGTLKHSIPVAANRRSPLALTPDGKMLATVSEKGVRLWDVASGQEIRAWSGRVASRPVFSPDGKRLAWIGFGERGGTAQLWTAERESRKPRAVGEAVNSFQPPCFSPDGKLLAVVTDAHVISVRDAASGKETVSFDAHTRPVIDLAFSADGRQVVSRGNNDLFVWQARTGKLLRRALLLPPGHEYLAPLLPGGYVLTGERTSNPLQGRFWLRDLRTGESVMRFAGRPDVGPPTAVTAPGGRFVAVRGRVGEICVLDVSQHFCMYRFDPKEAASGLKLSADGDVLVWYRRKDTGFEIHVHRQTRNKTLTLPALLKGDSIRRCLDNYSCVSPDGHWLLLPSEQGLFRRWDLTTGKEAPPLTKALRTVWEFVWSPDGRFVAAQGSASPANVIDEEALRDVHVWDVRTGKRLAHLTVPNRHGGMHLRFADDGRTMMTTDLHGVIHLWEVATGQERGRLRGHLSYEIGALALSADGRMLVSGGYDSQGFVWDLTGRMPDGQWRTTSNSSEQRRAAWEALASSDAKAAYHAIWQLAADPEGTVVFLREQVHPIARPDPKQVAAWLAALDSAEFAERERAERALEASGETVAAELRRTLTQKPTLEVRRRIEALLEKLHGVPRGRQLQALRSLEVLEHIGTQEARTLLRKLAEGAAGARLTEEARQSLRRCQTRRTP